MDCKYAFIQESSSATVGLEGPKGIWPPDLALPLDCDQIYKSFPFSLLVRAVTGEEDDDYVSSSLEWNCHNSCARKDERHTLPSSRELAKQMRKSEC